MNKCPKCSAAMVRASSYDPDGSIPLYGGKKEFWGKDLLKEWWVCINPDCEDGKKNTR